jgi:hypothetical protein
MGTQRTGWVAGLAVLIGLSNTADARDIAVHLEGGFGPTVVRPLERERGAGLSASAGAGARLVGHARIAVELTATTGGDSRRIVIPEDSRPGDRMLTSGLLGVEMSPNHGGHGPFAFLGAGAGHSNLKNARGVFAPPYTENWFIPSRSLTAFAFGVGAGYRFGGGPGPFGFQFAFRSHALVDAGRIPASAWALTVGLAY